MKFSQIYTRYVPKKFRVPGHTVRGNNIYRDVNGSLKLVGQLEEGTLTQVSQEQLVRLFGGTTAFNALNAVGAVASVVNLGVSVLGFRHVSRLLRQIEDRIQHVEQSLDEVAELLGVVDQKINQLIGITVEQTKVLAQLHELVLSFETSRVHAALEALEVRSAMPQSQKRDQLIVAASEVLHEYRTWLAEQRDSTPMTAMPVRAELLRAEVAIILAETRARCIADDVHFAGRALQLVLTSAREEVERMYEELSHDHLGVLATNPLFEIRDTVEAVSWLKETSLIDASDQLVFQLGTAFISTKAKVEAVVADIQSKKKRKKRQMDASGSMPMMLMTTMQDASDSEQGALDKKKILKILAGDNDAMDEEYLQADAASFITSYRLSRNLESAVSLVAAMEVLESPVRGLLSDEGAPNSPALLMEWSAGEHDLD